VICGNLKLKTQKMKRKTQRKRRANQSQINLQYYHILQQTDLVDNEEAMDVEPLIRNVEPNYLNIRVESNLISESVESNLIKESVGSNLISERVESNLIKERVESNLINESVEHEPYNIENLEDYESVDGSSEKSLYNFIFS
jgi:hypothetical protein